MFVTVIFTFTLHTLTFITLHTESFNYTTTTNVTMLKQKLYNNKRITNKDYIIKRDYAKMMKCKARLE